MIHPASIALFWACVSALGIAATAAILLQAFGRKPSTDR